MNDFQYRRLVRNRLMHYWHADGTSYPRWKRGRNSRLRGVCRFVQRRDERRDFENPARFIPRQYAMRYGRNRLRILPGVRSIQA